MLKDTTYKQKFAMLKFWMPTIVESIKKDLKNDHLRQDIVFFKKYFPSKNVAKLTSSELAEGYSRAMAEEENAEPLGEFLANRWLLKNTEIYNFFEVNLSKINPNFHEIKEIDAQKSKEIINDAIGQFGEPNTYMFSVLNAVVFPQEIYQELDHKAKESLKKEQMAAKSKEEQQSVEKVMKNYELQISRLTDKYEKKLIGFERKYHQDIEMLKKQINNLQKQLNDQ